MLMMQCSTYRGIAHITQSCWLTVKQEWFPAYAVFRSISLQNKFCLMQVCVFGFVFHCSCGPKTQVQKVLCDPNSGPIMLRGICEG